MPVEPQPGRQPGNREPVGPRRSRGHVAAAEGGDDPRRGAADDRQDERRGRLQREAAVGVEEGRGVEARSGGELGHGLLGGGGREAAGAAAVDEAQRRDLLHGGDDRGAPLADLRDGGALHAADPEVLQRLARGRVADSGDLTLVGHQPGQPEPGAAGDLGGQVAGRLRRPDRRPLRADLQRPAQRLVADVDVDRDLDPGGPAAERALDQVELHGVVDEQDRRGPGVLGGKAPDLCDPPPVDGGIGEQDVPMPGPGEHQRLGDREAEQAAEALIAGLDPLDHLAATDRLRRQPDRLARGALEHRVGVGRERIQVDESERRLDPLEDRLVAVVEVRPGHDWRG